ncbi:23S rRNA (adenine(2030)-N(6))-methyltransferase RlmJ [Thiomicrospira microaerophila]|uniref:23S rRNA (adenine(2030)-N(6))-methyltransferase RlmJ n=1 Tax=Thiomicrospira microaerophila TaxID=406020 RepID=UPI00200DB8AA|nr:23S rRNA (adenine(2030)-N(6))-methyltransferase RlmJ [Thiomicrospira microaerophila]UQB42736.1 23S rRNA (adenine(2030)-N(6))-methyltransferase RlmJ [Thiomicrospira microaerophila]
MLSYRHAFHAGNFADVLKHLVLLESLFYLTQKDKPVWYADSHAGGGGYALNSHQAQKNAEFVNGIGRLWQASDAPQAVGRYLQQVAAFNQQNQSTDLSYYPGSPWLAQSVLREQDRLSLFELHAQENLILQQTLALGGRDRRLKVFEQDGFQGVIAQLPPKERRGLVLIDPSYEIKTDYERVVEVLVQAHKRFATGSYLLWYPVVERQRIHQLEKALRASGMRNISLYELGLSDDTSGRGMTASGMVVINPPWTLHATMQQVLPWLVEQLAPKTGFYRADILVEE